MTLYMCPYVYVTLCAENLLSLDKRREVMRMARRWRTLRASPRKLPLLLPTKW